VPTLGYWFGHRFFTFLMRTATTGDRNVNKLMRDSFQKAAKRCSESLGRAMVMERAPFREAEGNSRGVVKDTGADQERCCLSIMPSSAIYNDGCLTINF